MDWLLLLDLGPGHCVRDWPDLFNSSSAESLLMKRMVVDGFGWLGLRADWDECEDVRNILAINYGN